MLYLSVEFKEQQSMLTPDKIIEIFVKVDDFCKEFETETAKHQLDAGNYKIRDRKASLADSEIITVLIAFHSGHFTNLKHFYIAHICLYYKSCFPGLVSYNRFVELWQRVAVPMMLFLKMNCLGQSRGINFIDSTHIKVCHNRRIHNHKVFAAVAERGQCGYSGGLDQPIPCALEHQIVFAVKKIEINSQ